MTAIPAAAATTAGEVPGARNRPWSRTLLTNTTFWLFVINIALVALFTSLSINHAFLGSANLRNLMLDSANALLLGIAIAYLLGSGEFDISLGANLILSSVVGGMLARSLEDAGLLAVILVSLAGATACGVLVGAVNGLIVTQLKVNSLIATLAMLGIVSGVAYIVSGGTDVAGLPVALQDDFGIATLGGLPYPFLVAVLAWGIATVALRYTTFGVHLLAMGSSRAAAERAGLRTNAKLMSLFMVSGGLAGVAGFIDITRFGATNIAGHSQDSLAAITAAVIGGTLLAGGVVSMVGLLGGVVLAVILANGLIVINVSAYYQLIVIGAVLVIAVWIDQLRQGDRGSRLFSR